MSERLEDYLKKRIGTAKGFRSRYKAMYRVYQEIVEGRIRIRDPNPPHYFLAYLMRCDYCLWLWTALVITYVTDVLIALSGTLPLISYARYILGCITTLFIPGYVTVEALYPRETDLKPLERLALSIGLSLAIVPLIGLVLNYALDLSLQNIVASLTLYITIVGLLAAYRKYRQLQLA